MSKSRRTRSRFWDPEIDFEYQARGNRSPKDGHTHRRRGITRSDHDAIHGPKLLLYTSESSLGTAVMEPPFIAPFDGHIISVKFSVTGAPTSTMTLDVKLESTSIFESGQLPSIPSGSLVSKRARPNKIFIPEGSKLEPQLTATGSATGPLLIYFEWESD